MTYAVKSVLLEGKCDMIDSYKNIERLRYNIKRDLETLYQKVKADSENQRVMLIDECFSAILSSLSGVLISISVLDPFKSCISKVSLFVFKKEPPAVILSLLSIIVFVVVLFLASSILNAIVLRIKKFFRNKAPEGQDNTVYYKKFDDIACNGIMVSIDYKKLYESITNENEKTLYYLETLYHMKSAIEIMEGLLLNKQIQCPSNTEGVNGYRVNNVCNVVDELLHFLETENVNINLESFEKDDIKKCLQKQRLQLEQIRESVRRLFNVNSQPRTNSTP